MGNVIINEQHLTDIATSIRGKNGTENTYKPSEMAGAIDAIEVGSGSEDCNGLHIPEEALVISGDCNHMFAYGHWDWFVDTFGDKITTKDIGISTYMFNGSHLTRIPFDINFAKESFYSYTGMFNKLSGITEMSTLRNGHPSKIDTMFSTCKNLRYAPAFENWDWSGIQTAANASCNSIFTSCYSLREYPQEMLDNVWGIWTFYLYTIFYAMAHSCCSLDEIKGIKPITGTMTANAFTNAVTDCYRLKDFTFALQEDGTPYSASWKAQTIDFSTRVGYSPSEKIFLIINYNSGITADKEVTDDTTYQALKDDPDWFTVDVAYSRYNHDSAVNTINSLPDTSAYLASAGGTNTIKFKGEAGSATDGGAINTLTEEEIAVATAKGWTVTLV